MRTTFACVYVCMCVHVVDSRLRLVLVQALVEQRTGTPMAFRRPRSLVEGAARRNARAQRRFAPVVRAPLAGARRQSAAATVLRHPDVAGAALAVAAGEAAPLHQRHVRVRSRVRAQRHALAVAGHHVQFADVEAGAAHRVPHRRLEFSVAQVAARPIVHFVRLLDGDLVGRGVIVDALAEDACDDHCENEVGFHKRLRLGTGGIVGSHYSSLHLNHLI